MKGGGERARESETAGIRASDQASSRLRFTKGTAATGIPPCLSKPARIPNLALGLFDCSYPLSEATGG